MFMGFILHFYITFGTNLLTGGPAQICCFCLFQCFKEKEYQTESKRPETPRNLFLDQKKPTEYRKFTRGVPGCPRG